MENLTGKRLGPYEITAPIGEGGMAAVYQAYEARDNRFVALKVLPPQVARSPQFAARFQQEAQVIARLQHPHILPIYEAGADGGYTYIAMPLETGGTLLRLLRGRPLPPRQTLHILAQVGSALDYAHGMGVVHRDVKPSNVLLDAAGNCLLMDFGLAKVLAGSLQITRSGARLGTPQYMSPEQGRGEKVDGRSDLYALGVMLYEMATGRVPFEGDMPVDVIARHIHAPVPPPRQRNPALPVAVEAVVVRALAKRPEDRFGTADEMVRALREALAANRPAPPAAPPPVLQPGRGTGPTLRGLRRPPPPAAPEGRPAASPAPSRAAPMGGLPLWVLGLGVAVLLLLLCLVAVLVVGGGRLLGL